MKRLAHIVCQTKSKQAIWSGIILQTVPIRLPTTYKTPIWFMLSKI